MQSSREQQSGGHGGKRLSEALADGAPRRVGWFRYYFDDDRWEWSPQVQKMHGYAAGSVTPTTELVLSHKHPDDYRQIADTLTLIRHTRQAFSTRHRIIDVHGHVRYVVVVGDQLRDASGEVIDTHGYYVDITPTEEVRQAHVAARVAKLAGDRAVIEQAKGMLMVIYGVDAATAQELLMWRSEESDADVRTLAEQIVADFRALSRDKALPPRVNYDNLLLTAHHRLTRAN